MTDLERAKKLWTLLDHIDSLDDMCKLDDVAFRRETRRFLKQRFEILESDGQELSVPGTMKTDNTGPSAPTRDE